MKNWNDVKFRRKKNRKNFWKKSFCKTLRFVFYDIFVSAVFVSFGLIFLGDKYRYKPVKRTNCPNKFENPGSLSGKTRWKFERFCFGFFSFRRRRKNSTTFVEQRRNGSPNGTVLNEGFFSRFNFCRFVLAEEKALNRTSFVWTPFLKAFRLVEYGKHGEKKNEVKFVN